MAALRVLIVDDERIARNGLERLLHADPDVQIVGTAADGRAAIAAIRQLQPDLVFLDVEIPEIDGFGVVSAIGVDEMPVIVFVTAYDHYTLRAFDVHALDYLLKPFDAARLQQALKHAKRQVSSLAQDQKRGLHNLMEKPVASQKPLKRLSIKSGGRFIFLD